MDRLERIRRFRNGIASLLLGLCFSPAYGQGQASTDGVCRPPLRTAEYEISAGDWNAALEASIRDRDVLLEALGKRKSPPSAQDYLALGELIEKHFGYHYLAFEFYERALELANNERGRKRDKFKAEAERRRIALARRQFQALRNLILGEDQQVFVSPILKVLPSRNLIERRDMRMGNDQFLARYEQLAAQYYRKSISQDEFHRRVEEIRAETRKLTHRDVFSTGEGLPYFAGISEVSSWYFRSGADDDELFAKRIAGFAIVPEGFHLVMTHKPFVHKASKFVPEGMLDTPGLRQITRFRYERNEGGCQLTSYTVDRKDGLLGGFLSRFPEFRAEAADMIERVVYEVAVQSDNVENYRLFVKGFPNSPYTAMAQGALERKRFEAAEQQNTSIAFTSYLEDYPHGEYRAQAIAARTRLAFEAATQEGTEEALAHFLEVYPTSEWGDEARNQIAKLHYLEARESNTVVSYEAFLRRHPESRFSPEAQKAITAIRAGESFNAVRALNTLAGYRRFLAEFPKTAFEHEARAMVAFFHAIETRSIEQCETFFDHYSQAQVKNVAQKENARILTLVAELAVDAQRTDGDARALILLHKMSGRDDLLEAVLAQAKTRDEEAYALKRMPPERVANSDEAGGAVFTIVAPVQGSDAKRIERLAGFWANPNLSERPLVRAAVVSSARFEHRLNLELSVTLYYTKVYTGIAWRTDDEEPKRWQETFRASAVLESGNQGVQFVDFQFPRILRAKRTGMHMVSSHDTTSTQGDFVGAVLSID